MENQVSSNDSLDIAVIGMAGRFPGASNINEYWDNLRKGVESITFLSREELKREKIDDVVINNPNYVPAASLLENIEFFDAEFFKYIPKEAAMMDPQQRIFLEIAWETMENAGYDSERFTGAIGVFAGESFNSYLINNLLSGRTVQTDAERLFLQTSNDKDNLATRISYKLNLRGPSLSIQTACSTSLVAVHYACQSLLNLECDMALAGGVAVRVPQKAGYFYQKDMILSLDGHCRPFDERAQGTVFGSGAGCVLLKRLEEAIHDKDQIIAVIKGSAINNDGAAKVGYTAPSSKGQKEVIGKALVMAGVNPESIGAVEAHGTGTILGDPIEIQALSEVFSPNVKEKGMCPIGSVKGNIGHLENAAGIASLIKMALCLRNKALVPSINFTNPNPLLNLENSVFYVNTEYKEWQRKNDGPLRCGVSSFGIGGTNAHVVMEEYNGLQGSEVSNKVELLVISARNAEALKISNQNLLQYLRTEEACNLSDIAYTLRMGRKAFDFRQIVVCSNKEEAIFSLENLEEKKGWNGRVRGELKLAFCFSGQGLNAADMLIEIYKNEISFKNAMDSCAEILKRERQVDIRRVLFQKDRAEGMLCRKAVIYATTFAVDYSLAKMWMAWGVQPQAMLGREWLGESVAASLSGVISLEDALHIVTECGMMLEKLTSGQRHTNFFPNGQVPGLPAESVYGLFKKLFERFTIKKPKIPYLSNMTGDWIKDNQVLDPNYWGKSFLTQREGREVISDVINEAFPIILEMGDGLSEFVTSGNENQSVISVLSGAHTHSTDWENIIECLGKLWISGVPVNWEAFHGRKCYYRVPLPSYPFKRKRFWVNSVIASKQNQEVEDGEMKNKCMAES